MAALLSHSDKSPLMAKLREAESAYPPKQSKRHNPTRATQALGKEEEKKNPLIESEDVPPNQLSITNKVQL